MQIEEQAENMQKYPNEIPDGIWKLMDDPATKQTMVRLTVQMIKKGIPAPRLNEQDTLHEQ